MILGLVASRSVVALVILTLLFQAARHLAARAASSRRSPSAAASSARSSSRSSSAASPEPSACSSGSTRTSPTTARSCARSRAVGRTSSAPTSPASSSSSSTASPTTCCRTRCAPVACPRWPAGSGAARTGWATGTRCCPRPRRPARRASSTATTTASPTSAGSEKETGQLLVANHPEDATVIESRVSNGEGLLSPGGASISNIFTGDGDRAFLVMSTIKVKERGLGDSDAFAWFFVSPYNYITMIVRFLAEVIKENIQSRRQARAGIEPAACTAASRTRRCAPPPTWRCASLGTSLVIQEMVRGTPVIYMDYTDYDEIAHHSGPERPGVARCPRRRRPRAADAQEGGRGRPAPVPLRHPRRPRPEPGRDLPAALRRDPPGRRALAHGRQGVGRRGDRPDRGLGPAQHLPRRGLPDEGRHRVARADRHAQQARRTGTSRWARRRRSTRRRAPQPPGDTAPSADAGDGDGRPTPRRDLVVVAGGNLALIYFNASKERHDASRRSRSSTPTSCEALANHPGIGVLIVRSAAHGLICVGKDGIHYLDEERVEGEDPLAVYGEHAVAAVKRLDAIEHVGDIAVISLYDPETQRDRRLRGAHRGPRRPGRRADASVPALSRPTGSWTSRRSSARRWSTSSCAAGWSGSWACASGRPEPTEGLPPGRRPRPNGPLWRRHDALPVVVTPHLRRPGDVLEHEQRSGRKVGPASATPLASTLMQLSAQHRIHGLCHLPLALLEHVPVRVRGQRDRAMSEELLDVLERQALRRAGRSPRRDGGRGTGSRGARPA